jgi:electron transport complex protein RnfC
LIRRLVSFLGGIALRQRKRDSTSIHVKQAAMPNQLILPLQQHIGSPAEPVVKIGEKVGKYQAIARASDIVSAPIHAPTSGKVVAITKHAIPHPSGLTATCIMIEPDGLDKDRRKEKRHRNYHEHSPEEIRTMICVSGIVGLGGAGFPSHLKLDSKNKVVDTLIINAAECEPFITCDEMLIREQATEIIEGILIIRHALQAKKCIIGIENHKTPAINALKLALQNLTLQGLTLEGNDDWIELVTVPTVYPTGGEKQLIQMLTGKEVPSHGIPLDINMVCHNVATAYAVCRAVEHGEALVSRITTIAGSVAKASNLNVLIGTPICDLIDQVGGNRRTMNKLIIGGPMMGYAVNSDKVPVIKTTNCILVTSVISDVPLSSRSEQAMPCIRCGDCATVCPIGLLPQQLYWHARSKDFDKVQDYNIFDCIECGCCDYVCPSHIPLVQYYRYAKSEIWAKEKETTISNFSRERFNFHEFRLEREKQERAERLKRKRDVVTPKSGDEAKKTAIQAAIDRVRAKGEKKAANPQNINNLATWQNKLIDAVDSRRKETADEPKQNQGDPKS